MSDLFEEAGIAPDALRKRPGFVPEDLRITVRLAQRTAIRTTHDDLFDVWLDGSQARRAAEKDTALARVPELAAPTGPRRGVETAVEAAEIPECSRIAAADALGVRTQRGQRRLPG